MQVKNFGRKAVEIFVSQMCMLVDDTVCVCVCGACGVCVFYVIAQFLGVLKIL